MSRKEPVQTALLSPKERSGQTEQARKTDHRRRRQQCRKHSAIKPAIPGAKGHGGEKKEA